MSQAGNRLALADAEWLAAGILEQIVGEAHVVGSVRRKRPEVGDIEIAVHESAVIKLSVAEGLFPGDFRTIKGGKKNWRYWQLRHNDGWILDLFRFDDHNRGSIILIRTGPVDFSHQFVVCLRRHGLRHENGYIRDNHGTLVACEDEQAAFAHVGMRYLEPECRE